MRLTAWEEERLLIFSAAELARRHREAGLRLNAPEAIALICDAMLEAARAGADHDEVEAAGYEAVGTDAVLPGVTALVLHEPLGPAGDDAPGAVRQAEPAERNDRRDRLEVEVTNTSTRVVRVSSHYPFERVNRRLEFDRPSAAGHRLDIEAGSTERWAPGETRTVRLIRVR
jgi:urease subunit gamma/beta